MARQAPPRRLGFEPYGFLSLQLLISKIHRFSTGLEPPNAATLQALATVRLLGAFEDLHAMVHGHACAEPADMLFAQYKVAVPRFIPAEWLDSTAVASP